MNRLLTIVVIGLTIIALAAGVVFVLRMVIPPPDPGEPSSFTDYFRAPVSSQSISGRTKEAARATFQQAINKNNIDNTKLQETSIAGDYALQNWAGDIMGGQAVLKYDTNQGRWGIVESSGGVWSEDALVSLGVPLDVAKALLAGLPAQK